MKIQLCLAWLALACASTAHARAKIVIQPTGRGFSDTTPMTPVGGNTGKTLGEQRKLALEHAAELWGARLDSAVPIVFSVSFDDMDCQGSTAVLGGTTPTNAFTNLTAQGAVGADPDLYYVGALADALVGRDLQPGKPDIEMVLNASVDTTCKSQIGGFYYGFDSQPGEQTDFVHVILHELGHGLGITSLYDSDTGDWVANKGPDAFSAHVRDLDLDRLWPELTSSQRLRSAVNVRRVAWDGPQARRLLPGLFEAGTPSLRLEPEVPGYSGFIADADFGKLPGATPAVGNLEIYAGCSASMLPRAQFVLVRPQNGCKLGPFLDSVSSSGIAALLLETPVDLDAPAMPLDVGGRVAALDIPVISLSRQDAQVIATAAARSQLRATITTDPQRRLGADDKQRPLLFVSQPYSGGSSIAHLEELVRPSQLMEPFTTTPTHDLTFTAALLQDVGWRITCGNGVVDEGEECDDGPSNGAGKPGACRTDCRAPHCGDGIKDENEECDDGSRNDDAAPNACRKSCKRAACGDGVLDRGESCDRGKQNSDTQPNACRTSCKTPACGDGVLDTLEQCDEGKDNSDVLADACRVDCRSARCGDGVTDEGEECDEGRHNGDAPDACRRDCRRAKCGDGVVDRGEACDGTPGCGDSCQPVRADAAPAKRDEPPAASSEQTVDAGQAPMAPHADSGCGCRTVTAQRAPGQTELALVAGLLSALLYRRRRARRARELSDGSDAVDVL